MLNTQHKQKYIKIHLNETFGWHSPEAPLWVISLNSDLPSVSSQCCRSEITDYLAGLQDISLQWDSDQKVSTYHYCCINSSKTSPDWRTTKKKRKNWNSSQLTVQGTMENFHKESNTWDVQRRFQSGQICAEGWGDLAEPAADQRQIEKELRHARAVVLFSSHADI